jgi:acetyl-CoA carboxylase biotin carboxylase subunit
MRLLFTQESIKSQGHAIEVRINAENPVKNFMPSPGTVTFLHVPQGPGIRFDSMLYQDYTVSPHYDSMVGKLIVHASDRAHAISKMKSALEELITEGITTNQWFVWMIMNHQAYVEGSVDTSFIVKNIKKLIRYEN